MKRNRRKEYYATSNVQYKDILFEPGDIITVDDLVGPDSEISKYR